ncbi:MAG: lysozyme [Acidobacteriia bacterium]|nr:lysozyme [Terriglobia bacterium]
MEPSEACYTLAEEEETLQLAAYPDPGPAGATIPTIGYGHTRGVQMGDTCTPDQAQAWLREDMAAAAAIVNQHFPAITQGQFDALADFCFNVGPGVPGHKDGLVWLKSGEHSTLMKLTLAGRIQAAADQFPLWNKAGGVVMGGLTRRRAKERALFLS